MTDSTDTQALSSAHKSVAVAEPLAGMLVAGYIVLYMPESVDERSCMYGMFNTLESAQEWAGKLKDFVTIHHVYEPVTNRG